MNLKQNVSYYFLLDVIKHYSKMDGVINKTDKNVTEFVTLIQNYC
jgi:hypothetical protein